MPLTIQQIDRMRKRYNDPLADKVGLTSALRAKENKEDFETHLINAVGDGDAALVGFLLANGNREVVEKVVTPLLFLAVEKEHTSLVSQLLYAGAEPRAINKKGQTVFHLSAEKGDYFSFQSLIQTSQQLDKEIPHFFSKDSSGKTVLDAAVTGKDSDDTAAIVSTITRTLDPTDRQEDAARHTLEDKLHHLNDRKKHLDKLKSDYSKTPETMGSRVKRLDRALEKTVTELADTQNKIAAHDESSVKTMFNQALMQAVSSGNKAGAGELIKYFTQKRPGDSQKVWYKIKDQILETTPEDNRDQKLKDFFAVWVKNEVLLGKYDKDKLSGGLPQGIQDIRELRSTSSDDYLKGVNSAIEGKSTISQMKKDATLLLGKRDPEVQSAYNFIQSELRDLNVISQKSVPPHPLDKAANAVGKSPTDKELPAMRERSQSVFKK